MLRKGHDNLYNRPTTKLTYNANNSSPASRILFNFFSPKEKHRDAVFHDVINEEALECRFTTNSYKISYIAGTENFMYRMKSLTKAGKVGVT